jgi:subtilisin family serine protease
MQPRTRTSRRALLAAGTALLTAAGVAVVGQPGPALGDTTAPTTYLVVYKTTSTSGAAKAVASAGGSVVADYASIGVVVARSDRTGFASTMSKKAGVDSVAGTRAYGSKLDPLDSDVTGDSVTSDSLAGLQWDMDQIHAPEAHAVEPGSSSVTVGDIDTGLDWTHPDLAANVDFANSVSCVSGVPDTDPGAWMDDNGHGTHTAGTIAAAQNGIGITGVAPGVKVAGIKAGNAAGFFFPEAVVCSFMWVAAHHIPVTNNSYFADPWLFNCVNNAEQRAIYLAESRAIRFAQQNGDVVVAAEGNQSDDLAHPTFDATSPDDTTPVLRPIDNNCFVVPVEVPGVIGVSATGNLRLKSFYSSYGSGVVDVAAPGGDSLLQRTAASPNGRVLSTWPASLETVTCLAARRVVDASGATYCYQQGTSMAAPHVAGVAALVVSHFPGISAGAVLSRLQQSATPLACPDAATLALYAPFPAIDGGAAQTCTGDSTGQTSWFGAGEVDALAAVS